MRLFAKVLHRDRTDTRITPVWTSNIALDDPLCSKFGLHFGNDQIGLGMVKKGVDKQRKLGGIKAKAYEKLGLRLAPWMRQIE